MKWNRDKLVKELLRLKFMYTYNILHNVLQFNAFFGLSFLPFICWSPVFKHFKISQSFLYFAKLKYFSKTLHLPLSIS